MDKRTQAREIIDTFGGPTKLRRALERIGHKVSLLTIYRWTYPRGYHDGTGGIIPGRHTEAILQAAALEGVWIREDLYPFGGRAA